GDERPKPSPERLREFGEARLPLLETRVLRPVPVPRALERVLVTFGLRMLRDTLGPDASLVQAAIGKRSPEEVAREAVDGTHLDDPRVREALWKGGAAAVAVSRDPMIALARRLDPQARAIREDYENRVEGALARNGELLFQGAVAVRGTSSYPDGTGTLRLSYGTISGWTESGKQIPSMTHVSGLYARNTGQYPFAVAPAWLSARPKLDPDMPYNVATTNDIIGGNSGSPLIDRNGAIVGLIFDGNRASLGGDYGYDAATNRAVALHGQAILEGLEKVYGAGRVVKEIRSRPEQGGHGSN
ncbi:MAG TPA: S46 family peptidase, partial [Myxococcaceae bacterium]|nr:S46 family peptidase [Myxococcaceae bacterium]